MSPAARLGRIAWRASVEVDAAIGVVERVLYPRFEWSRTWHSMCETSTWLANAAVDLGYVRTDGADMTPEDEARVRESHDMLSLRNRVDAMLPAYYGNEERREFLIGVLTPGTVLHVAFEVGRQVGREDQWP